MDSKPPRAPPMKERDNKVDSGTRHCLFIAFFLSTANTINVIKLINNT